MKVKYIGETRTLSLTHGKIYDVMSIEGGWYRILDDEGYDEEQEIQGYLYPPAEFEIVEE